MAQSDVFARTEEIVWPGTLPPTISLTAEIQLAGSPRKTKFSAVNVGSGSQGWVYQCLVPGLRNPVAAKIACTWPGNEVSCLDAAEREGRAYHILRARRVRYVTRVLQNPVLSGDIPVDAAGRVVRFRKRALVMEYHPASMTPVVMAGNLDLTTVAVVVQQLAFALQDCHWAGVAHLDIKPSNVLLAGRSWEVRLCDFGSAAIRGEKVEVNEDGTVRDVHAPAASTAVSSSSASSSSGSVASAASPAADPEAVFTRGGSSGTGANMAPEVVDARYGDTSVYDAARCDMWSLGVMIFRMAFNGHPFGRWRTQAEYLADPGRAALRAGDFDGFWAEMIRQGKVDPSKHGSEGHGEIKRWLSFLLRWDPVQRPRASQMLQHPWLSKPIPETATKAARAAIASRVRAHASAIGSATARGFEVADSGRTVSSVVPMGAVRGARAGPTRSPAVAAAALRPAVHPASHGFAHSTGVLLGPPANALRAVASAAAAASKATGGPDLVVQPDQADGSVVLADVPYGAAEEPSWRVVLSAHALDASEQKGHSPHALRVVARTDLGDEADTFHTFQPAMATAAAAVAAMA